MHNALHNRQLVGVTLAMLLLAFVVGCTSSHPNKAAETGTEPAAAVAPAADDIVLPLNAFGFTAAEDAQIDRARELLIGDCMRRRGRTFDVRAALASVEQGARNQVGDIGFHGNKRRYGIARMDDATRYGYHLMSVVTGTGRPRASGQTAPDSDCVTTATTEIAGVGPLGQADLVTRTGWESFRRSLTDVRVTEALAVWSTCMRAKGYRYPGPLDAGGDFDLESPAVSPAEIAAAAADVACKREAHLVEVWRGVEVAYQQDQIRRQTAEFDKIKASRDALMKRVADILATKA